MRDLGGWQDGALTEDTDLSFKLMLQGKQIALAYQAANQIGRAHV